MGCLSLVQFIPCTYLNCYTTDMFGSNVISTYCTWLQIHKRIETTGGCMQDEKTVYDVIHLNRPIGGLKAPSNIWVTGLELKSSCATYSIQFSASRMENPMVQRSDIPTISQFIREKALYAGSFWTQNLQHAYELGGNATDGKVMVIPHFYYLDDVIRYATNCKSWLSFIPSTITFLGLHILVTIQKHSFVVSYNLSWAQYLD